MLLKPERRRDEARRREEAVPSGCQRLSTEQKVWEIWKPFLLMLNGSGLSWNEDEAEEAWGEALL